MPKSNPNHESLAAALAAAQAEITDPVKDKTAKAGSYSYKYTDIAGVLEVVRPVLSKHGIAVHQGFDPTTDGRGMLLTTTLMHGTDSITSRLPIPRHDDMQKLGSAITYARRYALCAAVGVAADSDDDGASASRASQGRSERSQPSGATLACPQCSGGVWDNVEDRRAGTTKRPALSCKDRACGWTVWEAHEADAFLGNHGTESQDPGEHDPSWEQDRPKFCAQLGDLGTSYDDVAAWAEAQGMSRPSRWTFEQRQRLLADLAIGAVRIEVPG